MKLKQFVMVCVVAVFVVGVVAVPAAQAKTTTQNTQNNDTTRPGWGFGDKNHHHVGPPGHSVRPGDGDNDNNDQGGNNHHISQAKFNQFLTAFEQLFHKFFG